MKRKYHIDDRIVRCGGILACLGIFLMLIPVYIYSTTVYGYTGYYTYTGINTNRLFFMVLIVAILALYANWLKSDFLRLTYYVCLFLLFIGEACIYVCDNDVTLIMIIIIACFLFAFKVIDKFTISIPKVQCSMEKSMVLLFIFAVFMIVPALRYVGEINLRNLLLKDIYETRYKFKNLDVSLLFGYIKEPLARVVLPFLILTCYKRKKCGMALLSFIMLLYLFLCGGLKSIFFGFIALVVFSFGRKYKAKANYFVFGAFAAMLVGVGVYYLFDIDDFVYVLRRVFIIPPRFNKYYVDYFTGDWTHYSHSGFALVKDSRFVSESISEYVGRYVMGTGTNANTGLFVEGYYSFGMLGGILYLLIPLTIIFVLKEMDLKPSYYGLVFVYIYYMNTSIFSTLLLSHGLLAFLVIAFLFLRNKGSMQGEFSNETG